MSILNLISIGPGDLDYMLPAARAALMAAETVIGYGLYLEQLAPILRPDQSLERSALGNEMARAARAVELAADGQSVALVSSGDIGIYAMASPVFDVLRERGWRGSEPEVAVYPGVSAIQATAAKLGAPLGHDFCTISLSDLLTPWPVIERRVMAAAWGDFVIGFYNPRSQQRDWQLARAQEILLAHRAAETPVALSRNVTRADESITLTTLGELDVREVDMFTLVLVGNSQSYVMAQRLATPRGYTQIEGNLRAGDSGGRDQVAANGTQQAALLPVALRGLAGARVVVVGAGAVGERKGRAALAAGAAVRFISPAATASVRALADGGEAEWLARPFRPNDLAGARLAFAATNDRATNAAVAAEARRFGILCNVADAPEEGDFHSAAALRHEGLVIGVNCEGGAPKRAVSVRDSIAEFLRTSEATP